MKKKTAKEVVQKHLPELRVMKHGELFEFSRDKGFDSKQGFGSFKRALKENGINYNQLRVQKKEDQLKDLESKAKHHVTLYSDAKASKHRFAVCDSEGNPVWHGRFFESDYDFNGEQSTGEMSAAKKAVFFASKIKEELGEEAIKLTLKVDAQWLCYANFANDPNHNGRSGGKALKLAYAAKRANVLLEVEHVKGINNPADEYTICRGYKKWQDNELKDLAKPI